MRRLWAHICIAAATLIAVFASVPSVLKQVTTNGDYQTRRQFTFQLRERVDSETQQVVKSITDDSAKEMAKEMESRLQKAGVTSFEVSTSGKDIVTASYYADSKSQYDNISTYLTFSGSFALMSSDPMGEPLVDDEFLNGSVYLNKPNVNEYPTIYIPLKVEGSEAFTTMLDYAIKNPEEESSASDDSEESKKVSYLYIIYNYEKGDTYANLQESGKFSEKQLLKIDVGEEKELDKIANDGSANGYAKDSDGNYFFYQKSGYQDANGNSQADANEVSAAYKQADFLVNLFNASGLDYEVKLIRGLTEGDEVRVDAKIENIFKFGSVAWTSTLTAVVAAIVIVSLLLVVFYRLSALAVMTTTCLSTFLSFLLMTIIGLEYDTLALVGLIVIALVGLVSGVIYSSKLKDECYKGRTLKKANSEASRKSTLPILDIHVVTLLVGLFSYLLGGTALHSFGSIVLLGSLISFLINLFGLKGLFWLSTNTTKLTGKYNLFAVDPDKVPNHMLEEKQSYFGPYADKDFNKAKKPVSIVAIALSTLSLVGIILMGALNGGQLLKGHGNQVSGSEILVVNRVLKLSSDTKATLSEDELRTYLGETKVYDKQGEAVTFSDDDTHKTLLDHVTNISTYTMTETETGDTDKTYFDTYYQVSLDQYISGSTYALHKGEAETTIDELFAYLEEEDGHYHIASLKAMTTGAQESNTDWGKVLLATAVAIATLTVYLFIRYRISRPLVMLIYPVASSLTVLGLLALVSLGLAIPSATYALVPIVSIFSYFVAIIFANKERDLILDEKERNLSIEKKLELSKKAFGMAYAPMLVVAVLTIYILINFFGFGPNVNSYIYLGSIIACLLSFAFLTVTYLPYSNFLMEKFSKINLEVKPRKNKKGKKEIVKGAEPEESIFIGIND